MFLTLTSLIFDLSFPLPPWKLLQDMLPSVPMENPSALFSMIGPRGGTRNISFISFPSLHDAFSVVSGRVPPGSVTITSLWCWLWET